MQTTVVDHPLAGAFLADLRDSSSRPSTFRAALEQLGTLLVYEACRHLATVEVTVDSPLGPTSARRLADRALLVPVLRAGLGLLRPALALLPDAEVAFVGVSRDEHTFRPVEYVAKVPAELSGRPCIVLDPMLATGGSLEHTCGLLRERGVDTTLLVVCVLAAPEGLARMAASDLDVHVVTAAVDSHLDERRFIVPGLGDAGDRQYGTPVDTPR